MTANNFTMLAQNSKDNDYLKQAYLAALSIKATTPNSSVCVITNEKVPLKYTEVFDYIVDIPWGDHAENEEWKIQNRWKIYHAIPYKETLVIDTDMLILQDISSWFDFLKNYDLYFTSNVYTYRGDIISSDFYRRAFTKYHLPNIYTGLHYFKKSDLAHEFYKWLEMITNNWQQFYKSHANNQKLQKWCSMDVNASIACKIMDIESQVTNPNAKNPSFVHMKTKAQNWTNNFTPVWQNRVATYMGDDLVLRIGNYKQHGVFHYTEDSFVTDKIIKKYETHLGI